MCGCDVCERIPCNSVHEMCARSGPSEGYTSIVRKGRFCQKDHLRESCKLPPGVLGSKGIKWFSFTVPPGLPYGFSLLIQISRLLQSRGKHLAVEWLDHMVAESSCHLLAAQRQLSSGWASNRCSSELKLLSKLLTN
ncbi:uncharacterized protein RBU33_021855 [Hipposideros larvatus]